MQEWADQAKTSLDRDLPGPPSELDRSAYLSPLMDGRFRMDADLDAEGGSLAEVALRLAESPHGAADPVRTPAHRRGDADVDGVAAKSFGEVVGGPVLDGVAIQRLLYDAGVHGTSPAGS
jgi:hypothetical protein